MRRIFAILLVIFIAFLIAYGLLAPWRDIVNGFALNVAGPATFSVLSGLYLTVVNTIGIPGLWAIGIVIGFFGGIIVMKLLRKADLGISGWSLKRRAKEFAPSVPVAHIPSTPVGATVRPTAIVETPAPTEQLKPAVAETVKEAET